MENVAHHKFVYHRFADCAVSCLTGSLISSRRPTVSSCVWKLWLSMPQSIRASIYRLMMRVGEETSSSRVFLLPFGLYAKYGDGITTSEALATHYISMNTSIPVPAILDVLQDRRFGTFFLMAKVPGRPLNRMEDTLNTVSPEQLSVFSDTMRDWLTQLRSLTPPADSSIADGSICGFLGGPFFSYRISIAYFVGPFESQDVFHAKPFCSLRPSSDPAICTLASSIRKKRYRLYLTHGDLSPANILVDDNYKPTGLVDWQCAAWMPEYWELTSALWRRQRYPGWVNAFVGALPQYKDEIAVEMELWKVICPF